MTPYNHLSGKFIEDITRRVNIKFYNDFEGMEACLKNHVQSMPRIINENLVQVYFSLFFTSFLCYLIVRSKSDREKLSLTSPYTSVSVSSRGGIQKLIIIIYRIDMIFIISKLIMAEFWYNTLTPLFGAENIRLIYTGKI